jgi:hypothetical protein
MDLVHKVFSLRNLFRAEGKWMRKCLHSVHALLINKIFREEYWDVKLCGPVEDNWRLERTYCLNLQDLLLNTEVEGVRFPLNVGERLRD